MEQVFNVGSFPGGFGNGGLRACWLTVWFRWLGVGWLDGLAQAGGRSRSCSADDLEKRRARWFVVAHCHGVVHQG